MHGQQNVKKMPVFFSNTVFVYYLFLSFHYYVFTDRVLILAKVCNYCSRAYWCLVVRPQVTKTISDCVLLVYRLIPNSTSRTLQSLLAKKSHDSKFNTAIINGRIITFRNDTINLIFLYTKTCVSQVHLFSPSALFTCDHNRLSNLQIDYIVVMFHRLETIWHSINMRCPPPLGVEVRNKEVCLQFTKVYFKETRAKKELLL